MNLKKFKKKLFFRNFFSKSKNGHNMCNVHFTFSFSTFGKKSKKKLMQRNALNGFSKFSVLHTTFFLKNQKVENKKKDLADFFF